MKISYKNQSKSFKDYYEKFLDANKKYLGTSLTVNAMYFWNQLTFTQQKCIFSDHVKQLQESFNQCNKFYFENFDK